ncbi:putative addiction module antidote protein [Breoghania corrubedonensis]|uniref:Putative addiction module antidote protein n=1 Tax=Breoghania corrubedonensis TaxID=665038 RepID=A0A2T5VE71_9HYPH|nr:addiction module antidote protein [Breoghania corrubedonensis]PTW62048.1 putative addiction module antidote protein [Breoghania corrubedonensis]
MDMRKIDALEKWDVQNRLNTPEDIAAYLEAVFEDGDPKLMTAALGDIAKSKGMANVAREAGVTREALYRALSKTGDPRLSTLLGVMKALGLEISVKPSTRNPEAA